MNRALPAMSPTQALPLQTPERRALLARTAAALLAAWITAPGVSLAAAFDIAALMRALAGARSGDKGGTVTLGVYARSDAGWRWLAAFLTADRLRALLPEAADLPVTRELLPGLRAVLFQVPGLLGEGVAAGTRFDPQAKGVGEWLRSRVVDVPVDLL